LSLGFIRLWVFKREEKEIFFFLAVERNTRVSLPVLLLLPVDSIVRERFCHLFVAVYGFLFFGAGEPSPSTQFG
jgi:hypothetical protein